VILGDLFEYWAGDDGIDDATGGGHDDAGPDDRAVARRTIAALHDVAARGVAVYLMHGNRDLLLGSAFATAAGATLLADPALADLSGRPVLLVHGDTWCTRDVDYLRFRGLVRDPQWQRDFLARPLAARRAFIGQARAQSEAGKRTKAMAIMDVTPDAVVDALRAAGVTLAIHGHTHRPATHRLSVDGRAAERHVLPDWDYDAPTPRGGYLALQDGVLSAVRLAP
jgi:UDP-2,3-diacylglucosamine hydrolase